MIIESKRTGYKYEIKSGVDPEVAAQKIEEYERSLAEKDAQQLKAIAQGDVAGAIAPVAVDFAQQLGELEEGDYLSALSAAIAKGTEAGLRSAQAAGFKGLRAIDKAVESFGDWLGDITWSGFSGIDLIPDETLDQWAKTAVAVQEGIKEGATWIPRGLTQLGEEYLDIEQPDIYKQMERRQRLAEYTDYGGTARTIGQFMGMFADPIGLGVGGAVAKGTAKVASPGLRALLSGSTQGAVWGGVGFQENPGERLSNALMGASVGGLGGVALQKTGQAINKAVQKKSAKVLREMAQRDLLRRVVLGEKPADAFAAIQTKYPKGIGKLYVPANQRRAIEIADRLYSSRLNKTLKAWSTATPTGNWIQDSFVPLKRAVARVGIPFESRLKDFSTNLFTDFRAAQVAGKLWEADLWAAHSPMDEWLAKKFKKLPKNVQEEVVDAVLFTGNVDDVAKKYGIKELPALWANSRKVFDKEYQLMSNLGVEMKYVKNYWPRAIKDIQGFRKEFAKILEERGVPKDKLEQLIAKQQMQLGRDLTSEEVEALAWSILKKKTTKQPQGFMLSRMNEVDPRLRKYYATPRESLHSHVKDIGQEIADRMFLQKLGVKFKGNKASLSKEALAGVLAKYGKEGTNAQQLYQVTEDLAEWFRKNRSSSSRALRSLKNITYMLTLANPRSMMTQMKDIGFSLYRYGITQTAKTIARQIGTRLLGKKNLIDLDKDLGLHQIGEEFVTRRGVTTKLLDIGMDLSGFTKMDRAAKGIGAETALRYYKKMLLKEPEKFIEKWKLYFGDDLNLVIDDLKAWRPGRPKSVYLREIALNELLDVQPLTMAQMPLGYIANPEWRIAYTLQTFMLRQLDFVRNDILKTFQAGNYREGTKKLIAYLAAMTSVGVPVEMLKDFIWSNPERDKSLAQYIVEEWKNAISVSKAVLGETGVVNPLQVFVDYFQDIQDSPGLLKIPAALPFARPWARDWAKEQRALERELYGDEESDE